MLRWKFEETENIEVLQKLYWTEQLMNSQTAQKHWIKGFGDNYKKKSITAQQKFGMVQYPFIKNYTSFFLRIFYCGYFVARLNWHSVEVSPVEVSKMNCPWFNSRGNVQLHILKIHSKRQHLFVHNKYREENNVINMFSIFYKLLFYFIIDYFILLYYVTLLHYIIILYYYIISYPVI